MNIKIAKTFISAERVNIAKFGKTKHAFTFLVSFAFESKRWDDDSQADEI